MALCRHGFPAQIRGHTLQCALLVLFRIAYYIRPSAVDAILLVLVQLPGKRLVGAVIVTRIRPRVDRRFPDVQCWPL